jgi:hypothetical protein
MQAELSAEEWTHLLDMVANHEHTCWTSWQVEELSAEPSAVDGNSIQLVLKKSAYIANLFPT